MADILHWIRVQAPPESVFEALTTAAGLSSWWTGDVEAEPEVESTALFGFGDRSVIIRMRVDELAPSLRVRWTCVGDPKEWKGTEVRFDLTPNDDGGTDITFTHGGWRSTSGAFRQCNTDWGRLMYSLKDYVEGRSKTPFMS